ncbi:cardiolipin synthase ClsB [Caenimonas aquaedulcis]|uniref:Cardiolipin synthase B n=1 Tax=Caenimonas aquaedulcis TaxID=2793270 RepID=A0A931MGL8_9BURK|nr:cardiolipin synthase ClsB [Caenimonas aquaedulcis]MBG9388143.1 cardiolipin synthase ClsB [Caenimonas aquaedulcis]
MAHALPPLRAGHELYLLQGSVEFFPALVQAMDAARAEVRLETYIFDFTGQGAEVAYALERAARRGVSVKVVIDGFGSGALPPSWEERFLQAGVQWHVYSPVGTFSLLRFGSWRRLHRKLCLVDGETAFCGGINILDDFHDPTYGRLEAPRFDFAVRVRGPLVAEVADTMSRLWLRMQAMQQARRARLAGALVSFRASGNPRTHGVAASGEGAISHARAALVLRDNLRNRMRIEQAYRRAIGRAHDEIVIANAYFVPGRKMRNALVAAARRGVRVQLLLQGRYEYFMQYYAARPIYSALLRAGVEIHEYAPSFLHAKVAVIDGHWATVGSSNLDPLSLLLAREANVIVEDAAFAAQLRGKLVAAMQAGRAMDPAAFENRPMRQRVMERIALLAMRLALAVQGKNYL